MGPTPSALGSRLGEMDVAQKSAKVGVRRGVVEELDSWTQVVVIVHPEFDVRALRDEIAGHVRAFGGEVVLDEMPNGATPSRRISSSTATADSQRIRSE